MGPTPLTWQGCRRAKPRPYLTHLPCYSCIFSNFNSPSHIICHCHFYFLKSCLLLEVTTSYSHPFIQKELGLYGPNTLYWIKNALDLVYPNLPKSFCRIYALNFLALSLFSIGRSAQKSIGFSPFFYSFYSKGLKLVEFGSCDTWPICVHVS